MEEVLTPEEYELYAAGWERGRVSQETFFDDPLPPGMSWKPGASDMTGGDAGLFDKSKGKSPLARGPFNKWEE